MSTSVKAPAKAKRKPRHIVPQACLASLNEPPRSALRWEEGSTNEATGVREFQAFASINGGEERQVAIISAEPRGKDRFFYRCEKILCFEEFDSDKMRVRSSFGIYGFNMADLDTQIGRSVKNVEITWPAIQCTLDEAFHRNLSNIYRAAHGVKSRTHGHYVLINMDAQI